MRPCTAHLLAAAEGRLAAATASDSGRRWRHRSPDSSDADSGLGTPTPSGLSDSPLSLSPSPPPLALDCGGDSGSSDCWRRRHLGRGHLLKRRPTFPPSDDASSPWQQESRPAMTVAASVPMRRRHLPASMWREPDVPMYSPALLPPLVLNGHGSTTGRPGAEPSSPPAPSTLVVCSAADAEDSLRRLFSVAEADKAPGAAARLRQHEAPSNLGAQQSPQQQLQQRRPPPARIRCRFVCGHDPRLSDSSGGGHVGNAPGIECGRGAARRLPPLSDNGSSSPAAAATQLLCEVAAWL